VEIEVGELSGAVPELLAELYPLASEGTPLEGSRLLVRRVAVRFECRCCGQGFGRRRDPGCPQCGSTNVDLSCGREIRLTSIDVEEGEGAGR
jgi:hydrogenase nickel incorporation protein HypA/HybF